MAGKYPSKDEISKRIFGRRFSQLSTENAQYITKVLNVLEYENRQGAEADIRVSSLAKNETARIVKQLREVLVNPGDSIELPNGVFEDAARVINYQSRALNRGRILDPKVMNEIQRDIQKRAGHVDPRIIRGITDHLTNTTGRFTGVGARTLRGKLGSFLTKEELATISNKNIVSARDIIVSHLFDKWSGGNLSHFVKPRLEDILAKQVRDIRKQNSKEVYKKSILESEEVKRIIDAVSQMEDLYADPAKLNSPIMQRSLKNMGLTPKQIAGGEVREAVRTLTHEVYRAEDKSTDFRSGAGLRYRRRTQRQPVTISNVLFTGNKAAQLKDKVAKELADIEEDFIGGGYDMDEDLGINPGDLASTVQEAEEFIEEEFQKVLKKQSKENFPPSTNEPFPFQIPSSTLHSAGLGTLARGTSQFDGWTLGIGRPVPAMDAHGYLASADKKKMPWSNEFEEHVMDVTSRGARSPLSRAYWNEILDREALTLDNLELYRFAFGKFASSMMDAGVPLTTRGMSAADAKEYNRLRGERKYKDLRGMFGFNGRRLVRPVTDDTNDIHPYRPSGSIAYDYLRFGQNSPVFNAVRNLQRLFPEVRQTIKDVVTGKTVIPGVKRVGIVGSKSWDDQSFMNRWLKANWDIANIMLTSSEVGKGDVKGQDVSFGAAYQASNWAHFNRAFEHKMPTRGAVKSRVKGSKQVTEATNRAAALRAKKGLFDSPEEYEKMLEFWDEQGPEYEKKYGKTQTRNIKDLVTYNEDYTTSDVIGKSDEIVAFFDRLHPSESTLKQITKIRDALFEKRNDPNPPLLRIVWRPYDTHIDTKIAAGQQRLLLDYVLNRSLGFYPNRVIDRYATGTETTDIPGLKFLEKGGSLKPSQTAIVGEAGPEMLVPDGAGGFNVIPNSSLRFLEGGTFTPKDNVVVATGDTSQADAHLYKTKEGKVLPSVSYVLSHYSKEAEEDSKKFDNIPRWVSEVGTAAHAMAESWAARTAGIDDSRYVPQDLSPFATRTQSPDALMGKAVTAAQGMIRGLDELGFMATGIEERFVDLTRGYSGTIDLLGTVSGSPAIIDLKAQGNSTFGKESDRYMMQVGAYASMFKELPEVLHVLTANRDTGEHMAHSYRGDQITRAVELWNSALDQFNARFAAGEISIPGMTSPAPSSSSGAPAFNRFSRLGNTPIKIKNGDTEAMTTMLTLDPMHNSQAVGKYLPKYGSPEWDKNPARLNYFGARFDDLANSAAHDRDAVHPEILKIMDEFSKLGVSHDMITTLANAGKGTVPDNPDLINVLWKAYAVAKKGVFAEKAPEEGNPLNYLKWEDFRTLTNMLEEAGKAFASTPDFTKSPPPGIPSKGRSPSSPSNGSLIPQFSPIPGVGATQMAPETLPGKDTLAPKKSKSRCPGVDLCDKTMSAFQRMFDSIKMSGGSGMGGGRAGPAARRKKELPTYATGFRALLEKMPILGLPLMLKRRLGEVEEKRANFDFNTGTHEEYVELLQKEEVARNKYLRSIRGATTSWLIFGHVMRIFGQTSQVLNKGQEAVGKGLGYIMDMFLMPLVPLLNPLMKALMGFGNFIRDNKAILAVGLVTVGYYIAKTIQGIYKWMDAMGRLPDVLERVGRAATNAATEAKYGAADAYNRRNPEMPNDYVRTEDGSFRHARKYEVNKRQPHYYQENYDPFNMDPSTMKEGYKKRGDYAWVGKTEAERRYNEKRAEEKKYQEWVELNRYSTPEEDARYHFSKGIASVPGTGNTDSVLAMLTPGEMVLPVGMARKVRGYADGGIVTDGMMGAIGGLTNMYASAISSPVGAAVITSLGMVSKTISSMMGPLAPALAGGVMAGKSINALKGSIERLRMSNESASLSGFTSLRTIAAAQLSAFLGDYALELGVAAVLTGIYAWAQGYGTTTAGLLNAGKLVLEGVKTAVDGAKAVLDTMGKTLTDGFDWIKDRFKIELPGSGEAKEIKTKSPDELKEGEKSHLDRLNDKIREVIEKQKERFKKLLPGGETGEGIGESKPEAGKKGWFDGITKAYDSVITKFPILKGVAGMTGVGALMGAMESNDPGKIGLSAAMGGAAQFAFNTIETKLGGFGKMAVGPLAGFVAPDFGKAVAHAIVNGEGALSPSNWPGIGSMIKGNDTLEAAIRVGVSTPLAAAQGIPGMAGLIASDTVGGLDGVISLLTGKGAGGILGEYEKSQNLQNYNYEGEYGIFGETLKGTYNALLNAEVSQLNAGGTKPDDTAGRILAALETLVGLNKQPTVNYNTVQMANSDPYALFQQFANWLSTMGNTAGVQRTG